MTASSYAIAIDGPAASGKSSIAKALAAQLDIGFISTGDAYRAAAWLATTRGLDPGCEEDVLEAIARSSFEYVWENSLARIAVDGRPLAAELRHDTVNASVSRVASLPGVRRLLVALQRAAASGRNVVMEGRDIGTVVLADTPYKFYIDASPEERQRRRAAEGQVDCVAERDRADSGRRDSPLALAGDAQLIDTTGISIAEAVQIILGHLEAAGIRPPAA